MQNDDALQKQLATLQAQVDALTERVNILDICLSQALRVLDDLNL